MMVRPLSSTCVRTPGQFTDGATSGAQVAAVSPSQMTANTLLVGKSATSPSFFLPEITLYRALKSHTPCDSTITFLIRTYLKLTLRSSRTVLRLEGSFKSTTLFPDEIQPLSFEFHLWRKLRRMNDGKCA